MPIGYNTLGIDEKRKVLYRNFHEISDFVYLVEISRNRKQIIIVLFEHYHQQNSFIADTLTEKVAQKLMADNDNNFVTFISQFYIKYGKLQINGFHNKTSPINQKCKVSPLRNSPG